MDGTLFRYWFFPKRWRLWSDSKRFGFLVGLLVLIGSFSLLPLLLLPARIGEGFFGFVELLLGMLFFLVVNVASALAGATLITRERELGAWEALVITPIGMNAILRGKWLARTLFTMGSIGLFVPFWLLFTGVVLYMNDGEDRAYYTNEGHLPHWWTAVRLGIFLVWLAFRIVGHAVPFVSLGMAVSACYRKTRSAVSLTLTIVLVLLPLALWLLFCCCGPGEDARLLSSLCLWPLFPNEYNSFTADSFVSQFWTIDLVADICWIVVLPILLLSVTPGLCRRLERGPTQRKVKPMSHGV